MRDWLFITHADDYWLDGFTYGDWRQYVARRPDGSLQPCRVSDLPFFLGMMGFFALFPAIFAVIFLWQGLDPAKIAWERAAVSAVVGIVMMIPLAICWTTPWELMTAVAPRSYDGNRHF